VKTLRNAHTTEEGFEVSEMFLDSSLFAVANRFNAAVSVCQEI